MYLIRPSWFARKYYPKAKWRFPSEEKKIYLTFDDGPHPEITLWVLSELKKHKAKATFFCVGENAKKHPEVLQKIISENHSVGNHTFNHLHGWKTANAEYVRNVNKCAEVVNSKLFRPPYGKIKKSQFAILNPHFEIIMWDVLSGDFDKKISVEKCLRNVITNTRNGSIVLFHDSEKAKGRMQYALPKFLDYFLTKGFSFTSLPSS